MTNTRCYRSRVNGTSGGRDHANIARRRGGSQICRMMELPACRSPATVNELKAVPRNANFKAACRRHMETGWTWPASCTQSQDRVGEQPTSCHGRVACQEPINAKPALQPLERKLHLPARSVGRQGFRSRCLVGRQRGEHHQKPGGRERHRLQRHAGPLLAVLAHRYTTGTDACLLMLTEDGQSRWEKPPRSATLALVAAGHEYRELARLFRTHARVDGGEVEACSVSRQHAHAVPAHANQEVSARPQDVLQAWRLGVEAIADREVAACRREPTEALAAFRSGRLQIGETGRHGIERRMDAPGRAVVTGPEMLVPSTIRVREAGSTSAVVDHCDSRAPAICPSQSAAPRNRRRSAISESRATPVSPAQAAAERSLSPPGP